MEAMRGGETAVMTHGKEGEEVIMGLGGGEEGEENIYKKGCERFGWR